MKPAVIIGDKSISLNSLIEVANGRAKVFISESDEFISRMEASRSVLHKAISQGTPVYGVTTGYGASCGNRIGPEDIEALGNNLIIYHGCGTGEMLGIKETRNVVQETAFDRPMGQDIDTLADALYEMVWDE